jgi:hypothetical protein
MPMARLHTLQQRIAQVRPTYQILHVITIVNRTVSITLSSRYTASSDDTNTTTGVMHPFLAITRTIPEWRWRQPLE